MKKTLKVLCTILALCFMMSFASAAEMGSPEDELKATAEYVMNTVLADATSADDYVASYNDVYRATLCLKAGVTNEDVTKVIDASIAKQMKEYDESSFLNAQGNYYYAYNLALAILYLQERGEDVTCYQNQNMLEMLETCYLNDEITVTAYGHQVVAAVCENYPNYGWDNVKKKIKEIVFKYYVDGEGIDVWGYGVSADDDGMIFPALFSFKDDEDVKAMIEESIVYLGTMEDQTGAIWSNTDSTALALKFAATYGYKEVAEKYYKALAQFKSATVVGGYEGYDPEYATVDVLYALLQYVTGEDALFLSADEAEYTIKEGADAEWVNDSDKDLVISSSANFSAYVKVLVDDKELDKANYTVESGSTKVNLKTTYLKTLPVGKHTMTIVSVDGKAQTTFTIKEAEVPTPTPTPTNTPTPTPTNTPAPDKDPVPPTGDNANLMMFAVLAMLSGAVLFGLRKER